MIKTEDYFREEYRDAIWQSTKSVGKIRKKEIPEYTPYKIPFLICKVTGCGLEISVRDRLMVQPDNVTLFMEVHALRHQTAGEFPEGLR